MFNNLGVSRETFMRLKEYQKLLLKWNRAINLVSKHDQQFLWDRHILDSLQLIKFIDNLDIHLVDLGSGAGFPGMVLSIAGVKNVTLIESNVKKCSFLLYVSKLSQNNIKILNQFITSRDIMFCDILTSRGYGSIQKILDTTRSFTIKYKILLNKSKKCMDEILITKKTWQFDYNIYQSLTSDSGNILEIENISPLL
ncbi:16S rRNA (guanine(527)-N(7))-methyltransferase RsmG [Rickettsia endosymbiont of Cardiosporidium cionae]|uniref:16S rRNA (guanine(527)-N(7))-methyltransferase RsmG n=1 Tax=Rickettsia endosymbiont of Cardiosporidium cionae TaxID=2777155 RepID=UPI0018942C4D|nr:16S rRNA (guanine(527)-N(7))-methyltransferase RsmG [Rickettsia endosymbiont of Cardiosporidium cionae]KAF8818287.1 16S rRNA (guanine(527)-N(7))-methyltransferase RsmG [Rickettsia endosymbiont of Cardiosporidium cionae]